MNIKGAIFDMDGTLLDSMFVWETIGGNYLKSRGIQPREGLDKVFKAMSLVQAAEYYQREYGLTDTADEIIAGVNHMVEHYYKDVVKPKDGVVDFLEKLKSSDVRMCVATATDRYLVKAALTRCGLWDYFLGIFTCGEIGAGKDQSKIFEAALRLLGTAKSETPVFEDALHAVRTAKNAGFTVVGVYDAYESDNENEIKQLVDIYISSYGEMGNYID